MTTEPQVTETSGGRPRWTRLAVLGLLMIAAGPALMLIAGLIYDLDLSEQGGFLGSVIVIPLAGALLVWFLPWWSRIVGILAALAAGFGMFWTAFGLAQPGNAFDFVPGLLVMPGALIAIGACIASIVAHRRDSMSTTATGGERTAIRAILGILAIAVIVSGALTATGQTTDAAADAAETVVAKNFRFSPKQLEVPGGSSILVKNSDPFFHTFTIEELDIDVELTAGDQVRVEIPAKSGTYRFYCVPHSSGPDPKEGSATEPATETDGEDEDEMAGTLTIS